MPITTINSKGSPSSLIWIIVNDPYPQDAEKGYLFSGSYGWMYDKMMHDAGILDYYVICRKPDLNDNSSYRIIENELNHYQPPIIICLEEAGKVLCPELNKKFSKHSQTEDEYESDIAKYAGSLLQSNLLHYPHYIIPSFKPDTIMRNWALRDITVSLELGKAKSELDYFKLNKVLEPLPSYNFEYNFEGEEGFAKLIYLLQGFKTSKLVSNDIETIYPNNKKNIFYAKTPGYPVCVGLSSDEYSAISFELFRENINETITLWRELNWLLEYIPQLGQNFMRFDANYYEMLGFQIGKVPIDTLIRHHVLWASLPHSLAFQTKQYLRQPYYKGMASSWKIKDLDKLKHYNCLDVACTFAIHNAQEREFDKKPYLR